jgi:hypothetical protein
VFGPRPADGALTTVKTNSSSADVEVRAPRMSCPPGARSEFLGRNVMPAMRAMIAIGAGSRNVARQLISERRPPRISPEEKPLAPKTV